MRRLAIITAALMMLTPTVSAQPYGSWEDIAADAVGAFGAEGTLWIVHKNF